MMNRIGTSLVISLALFNPIARSQSTTAEPFLVEPNRPIAYLTIDHVGFGALEGKERKQRVWFRFQNNCRLPIDLHVVGAPTDASDDKLTVMYQLVKPVLAGVEITQDGHHPERKRVTLPPDTMSEIGSATTVLPGEGVLFSVPTAHFSPEWEMHIPFWFRLPQGKGPRDENVWGGEPQMFLSYAFWDLPTSVQSMLKSKTQSNGKF